MEKRFSVSLVRQKQYKGGFRHILHNYIISARSIDEARGRALALVMKEKNYDIGFTLYMHNTIELVDLAPLEAGFKAAREKVFMSNCNYCLREYKDHEYGTRHCPKDGVITTPQRWNKNSHFEQIGNTLKWPKVEDFLKWVEEAE